MLILTVVGGACVGVGVAALAAAAYRRPHRAVPYPLVVAGLIAVCGGCWLLFLAGGAR
jgi:hypothetical protein